MWVNYGNIWLFYVGNAALILVVYGAKALILAHTGTTTRAALEFAAVIMVAVPITWALSPDWHNPNVYRIANFVGYPVAMLTVPCASFFLDLARREKGPRGHWYWRLPLEWFLAVPAWFFVWQFVEVFVLGWVWM